MRILLDTFFLIKLRKENKKAIEIFKELLDKAEDIVVPAVIFYELYRGAYEVLRLLKTEKELLWVESIKDWVTIPNINEEIAKKAGKIYSMLKERGLEINDGNILLLAFSEKDDVILTGDKNLEDVCKALEVKCIKI